MRLLGILAVLLISSCSAPPQPITLTNNHHVIKLSIPSKYRDTTQKDTPASFTWIKFEYPATLVAGKNKKNKNTISVLIKNIADARTRAESLLENEGKFIDKIDFISKKTRYLEIQSSLGNHEKGYYKEKTIFTYSRDNKIISYEITPNSMATVSQRYSELIELRYNLPTPLLKERVHISEELISIMKTFHQ